MVVYLFMASWIAAVVLLTIAFPLEVSALFGVLLLGCLVRDTARAA